MKKNIIIIFTAIFSAFGLFLPAASVFAVNSPACSHVSGAAADALGCSAGDTTVTGFETDIKNILTGIIGALAVVAVIFVVVGGIQYMTSKGEPTKLEKARKTILYSAIGLVVCALAFAIVNFAIGLIGG